MPAAAVDDAVYPRHVTAINTVALRPLTLTGILQRSTAANRVQNEQTTGPKVTRNFYRE